MDNPFDTDKIINQEAIDNLTDDQVEKILEMLTRAGY